MRSAAAVGRWTSSRRGRLRPSRSRGPCHRAGRPHRPRPRCPRPGTGRPDEEIELGEAELDVAFYDGASVDLGEAVAETLALALDPYPRAPDAEQALKAAGVKSEEEAGPFGALTALRDKMKE